MRLSLPLRAMLALGVIGLCSTAYGQSFSNTNPITINDGAATPFPSTISVSGLTGNITGLTIQLNGVNHTFPDDMGAVVVGPTGASVLLFDGPGEGDDPGEDAVNLTWLFSDAGSGTLPDGGVLTSGTFQPGQDQWGDDFSAIGGPARPYGTTMSGFNGTDGNGTWSLFVGDFVGGDTGSISGGWTINFSAVPEPSALCLAGLMLPALLRRRRA